MKGKKVISLLMASALVTAMLSGCGSRQDVSESAETSTGTETASTATEESSESQAVEETEEEITLRFSWWGGDSRHEATLECIAAFEKEHPNVHIEAEYGGFDGYQDKLSAALAGGNEPDIIQIDQPWMSTFMAQNPDFFVNLNDYTDIFKIDGFSTEFLESYCVYNDKLVALPSGTNAMNFLVNMAVLEEAGVEFGEQITWDDLLEQGKKVNAVNPDNYMINLDAGISFYITRTYLNQLRDSSLITTDYTVGFSVEEIAEAFEYTKKLYDEKVVIPYEEAMIFKGAPADNPKWNNNQLGGWMMWSSTADQQQWGDNAKTLRYPVMEGAVESAITVRPSQLISVSSNSAHPKEAVMFLDFMFNQDEGILALKDTRSVPANDYARNLLEENGLIYGPTSLAVSYAMENPGHVDEDVPNTSEVSDAFDMILEKLIYGQYSDATKAAQDAYDTMSSMLEIIKSDIAD